MADGTLQPPASPPAFGGSVPAVLVDIRPLTTAELIDRGFTLFRTHFAGFLLLGLLAQTAPLLTQVLITAIGLMPTQVDMLDKPAASYTKLAIILGIGLISQAVVFCFNVIVTFYTADAYLGKVPSVIDSLRRFKNRLISSLGTFLLNRLLISLSFLFPGMVLAAAFIYVLHYPPIEFGAILLCSSVTLLFLIISLIPVLIVFMRLWVTVQPVALEKLSGWQAIKRSSSLVRYDPGLGFFYWGEMRLSFLLLPLFIIGLLILSLTSLPIIVFQISETLRHGSASQLVAPPDSTVILSQILTFLGGSLIWPLYVIVTTLFYYDIRIRREGFDLEFMAHKLTAPK